MSSEYQELLEKLLNSDTTDVIPQSRAEYIMLTAINSLGIDTLPEPGSRMEAYLMALITKLENSGSSEGETGLPFNVEILETICENVELTSDNNTYTLPSEITLDYDGLYCLDFKAFQNGALDKSVSGCYFSRVINDGSENYISWLSNIESQNVILKSTQITGISLIESSILSIYKVSLNVSDNMLDAARKLEGYVTTASGAYSHAEGGGTTASGAYSHAEGVETIASDMASHAEGGGTTASGACSHAEGGGTIASGVYSHAEGKYNVEDTEGKYAHIVGNGESNAARSNAHTLDWDGNAWFAGTVEGSGSVLRSTTEGSAKKFTATVDDTGDITIVDEAGNKVERNNGGITVTNTAAVGQTVKITAVDDAGQPTEWEAVDMASGGTDAGYKDSVTLLDVTLDNETGGLNIYEYDVSGIEKTDVIIINILFPESYTGQIIIKNQDDNTITTEYANGAKGIVVGIKAMNGRYLHSVVSSPNVSARLDAPLSLFYGQLNGASSFERPKAHDAITKIKFNLSVAFSSGTNIRIYRW